MSDGPLAEQIARELFDAVLAIIPDGTPLDIALATFAGITCHVWKQGKQAKDKALFLDVMARAYDRFVQ